MLVLEIFDDERNFSYRSPYINSITKEALSYLTYDSSFKRFMIEKLKMPIRLSASSLDTFYTCPFKYYLSYCCNASYFEDSIYAILGNIAHKMIEGVINKDQEVILDVLNEEYIISLLNPLKDVDAMNALSLGEILTNKEGEYNVFFIRYKRRINKSK